MEPYTDKQIIEELKASMRMAGMDLTEQDIQGLQDIHNGKISEDNSVKKIIEEIMKDKTGGDEL